MINIEFQIDYSHCPKGHRWSFVPSSTLFPDVFWCEECDCFYEPSVRAIKRGKINKNYSSDREGALIERANFLKWKDSLGVKDMPKSPQYRNA